MSKGGSFRPSLILLRFSSQGGTGGRLGVVDVEEVVENEAEQTAEGG